LKPDPVKVLIVDDSGVTRELLSHILSADPGINVMGTATNGLEAIEFIARNKPDVLVMDIIMPKMDGYEATRRIMESNPLPIVIVSASLRAEEVERTWKAIELGAVAALCKPAYSERSTPGGAAEKLVQTVKLMSQVKVVRRWGKTTARDKTAAPSIPPLVTPVRRPMEVVAVGASTGGPQALREMLSALPAAFAAPILLVQHISPGFTVGFVNWLDQACAVTVGQAVHGEQALPGRVYVAPDALQMKIDRHRRIALTDDGPENSIRPSVSYLFRSVAHAFGEKALGVLLTGMGRDGADELKLMRDMGGVTIAQDKDSCVVYGMPGEAVKLGGAQYSLPPDKIAEMLKSLVK
jgi:two-component system, chemotaxis family, protein-glutamate methylesterase/glutaminase